MNHPIHPRDKTEGDMSFAVINISTRSGVDMSRQMSPAVHEVTARSQMDDATKFSSYVQNS